MLIFDHFLFGSEIGQKVKSAKMTNLRWLVLALGSTPRLQISHGVSTHIGLQPGKFSALEVAHSRRYRTLKIAILASKGYDLKKSPNF